MRTTLCCLILLGLFAVFPLESLAQTSTPTRTFSRTATRTPTPTPTVTKTFTPNPSWTHTSSFTPNPSLTPPCGAGGIFGKNTLGTSGAAQFNSDLRASKYSLSVPATIYTLALYNVGVVSGTQAQVGIYQDNAGTIGPLLVNSPPQEVYEGWNVFGVVPTALSAGNYWLAYLYESPGGYNITYDTSAGTNSMVYSGAVVTMGDFPASLPIPQYASNWHEAIYANYCGPDTPTPTETNTRTATSTRTLTKTPTGTRTATNTGTILTNTRTETPTATFTVTPTVTDTPNATLTPLCGVAVSTFGKSVLTGTTTSGAALANSGLRSCVYNLSEPATIVTMSLYQNTNNVGSDIRVAIYHDNGLGFPGSLILESAPQTAVAGWNIFKVPDTPLLPGNYWLAYLYNSSSTYHITYDTQPPGTRTLAYSNSVPWGSFPSTVVFSSYGDSWHEPIFASYCGGPVNTVTATSTLTETFTRTVTSTKTLTVTATPSGTPPETSTATSTPTITDTFTITLTPTVTESPAITSTLTITPTFSVSSTRTDSATPTSSATFTASPSSTMSSTASSTRTPTATPSQTATSSLTSSMTSSATNTVTATFSVTSSPTSSFTATATNTGTILSDTSTPTMTHTATLSTTSTSSATPTFSPSASPTPTETSTPTATLTPTNIPVFTHTATQSSTPTSTHTATPTITLTVSRTATLSATPTLLAGESASLDPNPLPGPGPVTLRMVFDQPHDYVTVKLFTTAFRLVYVDKVNFIPAGSLNLALDTNNLNGRVLANGLYYLEVRTPSRRWILKLVVLK